MIATRLRRWIRNRLDLRRLRRGIEAERRMTVPMRRVDRDAPTAELAREDIERMLRAIRKETER
jgi:hypothetical protein